VNTSILEQELAPLNAQIEQVRQKREKLEGELRVVEEELQKFSADRQRFDALLEVCNALDKLEELKASDLFWEGISKNGHVSGHLEQVRSRIAGFEDKISGILEKQASYQEQISQCLDELDFLEEEVRNAYDREERRKEEFIVEREVSPLPYRAMIMPWSRDVESESYFRRAILVALLLCLIFGFLIPIIKVPIPERSATVVEIPKRLVKLVKEDLPKPKPKPKPEPIQAKEDPQKPKEENKPKPEQEQKADQKPKAADTKKTKTADSGSAKAQKKAGKAGDGGSRKAAARKKAQSVGVLAFKDAFADLMEETPVAKVGVEARFSNTSRQVKGQAVAKRSLVAMQASDGSSGGIVNTRVSRNIGNSNVDRLGGGGTGDGSGGGAGFVRVESAIADLEESSRPLSDGGVAAAGRTDEEIQIVFDRYKAALYRIYNKELRKDPTLRGKILMRITIEPSGAVSMCKVESTDLDSPELVEKIVERVKRFNFGPKENVLKVTILYPIDFLPAG
jgi:hypothetical protein